MYVGIKLLAFVMLIIARTLSSCLTMVLRNLQLYSLTSYDKLYNCSLCSTMVRQEERVHAVISITKASNLMPAYI
jgi:hypothetical protein